MEPRDFLDTDRYPIDDLDSRERAQIVTQCRADLDAQALCRLPGFIRADKLGDMIAEMRALESAQRHLRQATTAYPWMDNSGFPANHPRSTLFMRQYSYLTTDKIPAESPLRALFMWDALTDFVRDALGFEALYRSVCPTQSIQLNYMREGDVLPWHFDTNDGVVSLLLDTAERGGHFEVAPYAREEHDEHYTHVMRAFAGDRSVVMKPEMEPGTFVLFKGRRSVHRVSPVGQTSKPRMVVLYSYDQQQNMTFTQASQERLRNPSSKPFLGARTPADAEGFQLRESLAGITDDAEI